MRSLFCAAAVALTIGVNAQTLVGKKAPAFAMAELSGAKLNNKSLAGKVLKRELAEQLTSAAAR